MPRLPSDHADVETYRARVARFGGTRRRCLRLPDEAAVADGDLLRLTVAETPRHARVHADDDGRYLRGAYANRRLARADGEQGATNFLTSWLRDIDADPGSSVELDELVPGDHYGVRAGGERVVYETTEPRGDGLDDIAESLEYGSNE